MKKIFLLSILFSVVLLLGAQRPVRKNFNGSGTSVNATNVMTLNIRYDNPSDGANNWGNRKDLVINTILSNRIDILGMQEALHNQIKDLESPLTDYEWIGVGRDDGIEKGEYSPIFYNTRKFKEIGSGYFWLSETPMAAGSMGWDAACPRIATWAKLQENATGKVIFVLNTHFDHLGIVARRESAKLILQKVNAYTQKKNLPVVVMGDFNATSADEPIKILTNSSDPLHLTDSRTISPVVKGTAWSFHDFGRLKMEKRELIDYIFVRNGVKVSDYEVIDGIQGDRYISDHNPVMVKVQY